VKRGKKKDSHLHPKKRIQIGKQKALIKQGKKLGRGGKEKLHPSPLEEEEETSGGSSYDLQGGGGGGEFRGLEKA